MISHYIIKDYYYKYVRGEFPLARQCFFKRLNGRIVIFIHIPKTAGTSLARALRMPPPNPSFGIEKHVNIDAAFHLAGKDVWQEAFKIACVRNPWDRLHSHYNFKQSNNKLSYRHSKLSFKDWGKVILNKRMLRMERPQSDWITPSLGQEGMDRILRFEDLTSGINEVGEELGIKVSLPHLLKGKSRGMYREAYDEELKELVAIKYATDIERFGYTFE